MASVSDRLLRRIRGDFAADDVERVVQRVMSIPESLPAAEKQDPERLQACVVLPAHRSMPALLGQLDVARIDWRDALVNAGLQNSD